jgi:poly-gamma-glutamate capsule biosynthesis protein CapA/YwtB (metallophosphatase superfamily)
MRYCRDFSDGGKKKHDLGFTAYADAITDQEEYFAMREALINKK